MNGQDEAPKGNQPQTLAALLLRYIQKKNLPEKEIAARAGLTRSHLKKILYGNLTPSFVRGLTLCRVLGIPHSEYELLAAGDNPESVRSDITSAVVSLGVAPEAVVKSALNGINLEDDIAAGHLKTVVFGCLKPFDELAAALGPDNAKGIRTAFLDATDSFIEFAQASEAASDDPESIDAHWKGSFVTNVLKSSYEGFDESLNERVNINGRRIKLPTIHCSPGTYLKLQKTANERLPTMKTDPDEQPVLYVVTALRPLAWYGGLDTPGDRPPELPPSGPTGILDYRQTVEALVKGSNVNVQRLVVVSPEREYQQAGLNPPEDIEHHKRYYILERLSQKSSLDQGRSLAEKALKPRVLSVIEQTPQSAILEVDGDELTALQEEEANAALNGDFRFSRVLDRFVNDLHTQQENAKWISLTKDMAPDEARDEPVSAYVELLGHMFDFWLAGTRKGPTITWRFGLSGEVFWNNDAARVRLLLDPELLQHLGDYWRSMFRKANTWNNPIGAPAAK